MTLCSLREAASVDEAEKRSGKVREAWLELKSHLGYSLAA